MIDAQTRINKASAAIVSAARRNSNITVTSLNDEMERGDIAGWLGLSAVRQCNFSEWTAAMVLAASTLTQ